MDDETPSPKLTAKQQIFLDEYLKCWNATEAARRAGYSEKTAKEIGAQNLTKLNIANAIQARLKQSAMSADEALARLAEQARGPAEFLRLHSSRAYVKQVVAHKDDGEPIEEEIDLPEVYVDFKAMEAAGKLHLLKGTELTRFGTVNYQFYDSQSALVHIGKHHKLFTDKTEVSGALTVGTMGLDNCTDDELKERLARAAAKLLPELS